MEISAEIYQEILDRTDFLSQIRLTQLAKYFYFTLRIYDFFNVDQSYLDALSDDILKNYKYIKKLNANNICGLPCITDEGISHMKLHTLYAKDNSKITDEGIKHMNLYSLNASGYHSISDRGIKHMDLRILDASYNVNIT